MIEDETLGSASQRAVNEIPERNRYRVLFHTRHSG